MIYFQERLRIVYKAEVANVKEYTDYGFGHKPQNPSVEYQLAGKVRSTSYLSGKRGAIR